MSNPADKSPANAREHKIDAHSRVPMSVPQRHLEVTEIPGYHLHWFLTSRVSRALRAGYTFVEPEEIPEGINNFDVAGDANASGNGDMGSRVSVPAAIGGDSEERLYLMKLPEEWWQQDQALLAEKNESIAEAIRGGKSTGLNGANPHDTSNTYVRQDSNLFTPKRRPGG